MALRLANLTNKKSVSIYTPLPALFNPAKPKAPAPDELTDLRLAVTLDWVLRVLKQQNPVLAVNFAEPDEPADIVVTSGNHKANQVVQIGAVTTQNTADVLEYDLATLRYYLAGFPYSQTVDWNLEALEASAGAVKRLRDYATRLQTQAGNDSPSAATVTAWRKRFIENLENNLDTFRALPVIWLMLQAKLPPADSLALLTEFDYLFNLGIVPNNPLTKAYYQNFNQPTKIVDKGTVKNKAKTKNASTPAKTKATDEPYERRKINSSRDIHSHLNEPDKLDFTVSLIAADNLPDLKTTLNSLVPFLIQSKYKAEIIIVDMNSQPATAGFLDNFRQTHRNVRVTWAAQNLGEAAGRNIALKQAQGKYLVVLAVGTIIKGDLFELLLANIDPNLAALYGLYPVKIEAEGYSAMTITQKQELINGEALDGFMLVWRRKLANEVGLLDEHFRHPYALGIDYSYNFYDKGMRLVALPELLKVLDLPSNFPTYGLDEARQKHKNWDLFRRSWNIANNG
jgi:hypothetical protein